MNTPVNFELAKLLKEKGWQIPTLYYYFEDGVIQNTIKYTTGMDYGSEFEIEFSELTENWNDNFLTRKNGDRCFGCSKSQGYFETFSAPSISDVVMWLYEKHGFWLRIHPVEYDQSNASLKLENIEWCYVVTKVIGTEIRWIKNGRESEPSKAYETAIEYCLNKLPDYIQEHDIVEVVEELCLSIPVGTKGTVVHIYPDGGGYEVEFVKSDNSIAIERVKPAEVKKSTK